MSTAGRSPYNSKALQFELNKLFKVLFLSSNDDGSEILLIAVDEQSRMRKIGLSFKG
jgi:hypothetical protein